MVSWDVKTYVESVGNIATFQFISWDPNPFDVVHAGSSYVVITVLMVLMFVINTLFSGYRIVKWIYTLGYERFEFNIGFGCLTLEWLCNLIRSFQCVLFTLHNNYKLNAIDILTSLPICITLITSILIVFFWLDLTSDPFYQGKFLGIMKIPAIIAIVLLIAIEILFDAIRTVTTLDFFNVQMAIYIILHLIVVLFNIVAGFKVLVSINKQSDGKKKLKLVIKRIIMSGIVSILGIILLGLMISSFLYYPVSSVVVYFLLFVTFWLQSLLLIMIFKIPKHREMISSTTNSSVKETHDMSSTKEIDTE